MSVNININKMNHTGQSFAERAEANKRKINRMLSVREQSSELAQNVLKKTRDAKALELKRLQQIKEKELSEWKKKTQFQIQKEIDLHIGNFGNAHVAAVDASCEEDESLREKRDEKDLMAAMRGRVAMLQVHRERERELENKILKKKRMRKKTVGIQADFLVQQRFSDNLRTKILDPELFGEEEENENYSTKRHLQKQSEPYNPQNYTANSIDSSNDHDSDDAIAELDEAEESNEESEVVFNQISNLLKNERIHENENVVDNSDTDFISLPYKTNNPKEVKIKSPKKKDQKESAKKSSVQTDQPVRFIDYGNKFETTYIPDRNFIVPSKKSKTNARENAEVQTYDNLMTRKINDDILKQLTELRSQEALKKEKIRKDYEKLRFELDELSKQEQEVKTNSNTSKNLSRDQFLRKEQIRQRKMNDAAEKAMKRNIITCQPVAQNEKSSIKQKSNEINVASASRVAVDPEIIKRSNTEINNLVKIEKLKDLLEKINHQKRLLLNEIEKSDDIPGPDLEKVINCIKKLEQEKSALSQDDESKAKLEKLEELNEREKKIEEREARLENRIRELYNKQKAKQKQLQRSSSLSLSSEEIPESSNSSEKESKKKIVQPPVEIIIKVQHPKSPYKKPRKVIDTLNRQPGKVYPKTPLKKKPVVEAPTEKAQQTSPEILKPILKTAQMKSISISPQEPNKASTVTSKSVNVDAEDNSQSTIYKELPSQIDLIKEKSGKDQRKVNPILMDYITRLLGMTGSHLNVDVSPVVTPGSSTINATGNASSSFGDVNFDQDRMNRLQKFIDENHSFIDDINQSLEKAKVQKEESEKFVEGVWCDIMSKKKSRDGNLRKTSSAGTATRLINQLPQKETPETKKTRSSLGTEQKNKQKISEEDIANVSKYLESQMLNNYSEYTANCQRRIKELTEMMDKVRQEKLKLIENSLSSNEFNNFTEYKEIAQSKPENATGSSEPKSNRDDPPSEEINNILQFQTRPFGVSKDSGISISRPVTSSDFRDSPDARVTSEENNNNIYKPIPKAPRVKVTSSDGESQTIKDISFAIKQSDEKSQKKQKPPLSLIKSPQHEAHELSTIVEIETPTASKVLIQEEISCMQTFTNYEDYGIKNENSKFPDLNDLKNALPDLNIKTFIGHEMDITKDEKLLSHPDLKIKTFVGQELDISASSSASSLMDIMGELKRRNIFDKDFEVHIRESDEVDNLLAIEKDEKTTPTSTKPIVLEPMSPKRKAPAQSRLVIKTPEKADEVKVAKTPTKHKKYSELQHQLTKPASPNSNDTLSGIQEIEKDFQSPRAASTLKKSEIGLKNRPESSESSSDQQQSIRIDFHIDSSSTSSGGQPLNLKDFLRRELLTRSRNDKYFSDDSSISSKFMRSLLKTSSDSSTNSSSRDSSQNAQLRTSTPVRASAENLAKTGASSQIFTGAESVSTVKDSSGSSKSEKTQSL